MLDRTLEAHPADDNTRLLTGSTPPGGGTPFFKPVASAEADRRQEDRGGDV